MSILDFFRRGETRASLDKTKSKAIPYQIDSWKYHYYDGKLLDMDVIRSCIDALSRNIAKMDLNSVMVKADGSKVVDRTSDIARVLKKPNRYMTQYDFMYKCASLYYSTNNVFIYPEYAENGDLIALYPINYNNFRLLQTDNGTLIAKFQIGYFHEYTVPYGNLIHLRNHYTNDEFVGDNNEGLKPVVELINSQNQGIINGIKNSAIIRGILKAANVIKQDDLNAARDRFVEDNFKASNNGGVIVLDGKFDYHSLESKPYIVDDKTMEQAKAKAYAYFGVNEAFVQNTFTPDQYEAVYEGRLEPYAEMFCQAMTVKLFTERERGFGNEIQASMEKLRYQTISTITSLITATNQLGLFTRNEYRNMIGFAPLSDEQGGNDILVSLNYTKNIDEYQGVNGTEGSNDE